ncbi:hypothetical protein V500_00751 [Pseudogymnoascus sp. VKM F-4518 (FW-2643)]|nr:hypothetical protein V500_00751 [Pseudogymnoascus sp. VKM F-4518 (FW-2643)]
MRLETWPLVREVVIYHLKTLAFQTGHTIQTHSRSYALANQYPAKLQSDLIGRYYQSSLLWRRFLLLAEGDPLLLQSDEQGQNEPFQTIGYSPDLHLVAQDDEPEDPSSEDSQSHNEHINDGKAMASYTEWYTYDLTGNTLKVRHQSADDTHGSWTKAFKYNEPSQIEPERMSNQLSTMIVGKKIEHFFYDKDAGLAGNITSMSKLPVMEWNSKNELSKSARQVTCEESTPNMTYYRYDARGQRVRNVVERHAKCRGTPTALKERVYMGSFERFRKFATNHSITLERETLQLGDEETSFVLAETRTLGEDKGLKEMIRYQYGNHINSVSIELGQDAELISYEEYGAFGNSTYRASHHMNGLYYYGARYYLPGICRWISCDPGGLSDGPNLYLFVKCNPVSKSDPNGREASWWNIATGVLTVLGGAAEIAVGTAGVATPTGVTQVLGVVAITHGLDTTWAGVKQVYTGEEPNTYTEQGATKAAEERGATKETAETIGAGVDLAVGVIPQAGIALAKGDAKLLGTGVKKLAGGAKKVVVEAGRDLVSTGKALLKKGGEVLDDLAARLPDIQQHAFAGVPNGALGPKASAFDNFILMAENLAEKGMKVIPKELRGQARKASKALEEATEKDLKAKNHAAQYLEGNDHHLFPDAMKGDFKKMGIRIDDFTIPESRATHMILHGAWKKITGLNWDWNKDWKAWQNANLNAAKEEAFQQPKEMMIKYGLADRWNNWRPKTKGRNLQEVQEDCPIIRKAAFSVPTCEPGNREWATAIVATNAFGLGIDAPNVRAVIHAGDIYQMRSYSQESGRGGTDGERSDAIVVMPAGKQEELQKKIARAKARTQPWKIQSRVMRPWEAKQVEWEKMERFLSGSKCRRIYLNSEMDDRQNRERCEVGEERCDVCEKDDAMIEDGEARQAAYIEEQRAIREQAAQDKHKRPDQWLDSGIEVHSSMSIPAPRGEVLVPGSVVVASPQPSTDQNPTPSEEGHSITRSRCSSVSFDEGFAADQDSVSESRAFEAQNHQRSQQRWRVEADSQREGHEVWNLETRLDSWVGKWPLCYVRQCQGWEVDVRHTLENCPDESRTKLYVLHGGAEGVYAVGGDARGQQSFPEGRRRSMSVRWDCARSRGSHEYCSAGRGGQGRVVWADEGDGDLGTGGGSKNDISYLGYAIGAHQKNKDDEEDNARNAGLARGVWRPCLPRETIELVAASLDASDFGSFRLLCRVVNFITLPSFQKRYFNTRYHMLQRNSLINLVDISKDPVFGPAIHTVEICIDHLVAYPPGPWDHFNFGLFDNLDGEEYRRALDDQTELGCAGLDTAYLTVAFANLQGCRAIRVIDVGRPWGAASMEKKLGVSLTREIELPESIEYVKRAFQVIFGAVMASGLRVESFDLALGLAWNPIRPDIVALPTHFSQQIRSCLTCLTTLFLTFDPMPKPGTTQEKWTSDFVQFLELFPAVRYLELELFVGDDEAGPFDLISKVLRLPHLQTVMLSGHYSEEDIERFAMNHLATLNKISVDLTNQSNGAPWASLIHRLREDHSIDLTVDHSSYE